MSFDTSGAIWTTKGATLSDKSAREEFGLTQKEILEAILNGTLQFRENNAHGNPYFKLIRSEVEAHVREKNGENYLKRKNIQKELAGIASELRKMKAQAVSLEKRKAELLVDLENTGVD